MEAGKNLATKELFVSATTWKKDSHGLFDCESLSIEKCDCALKPNSILARSASGELSIVQPGELVNPNSTPLFKLLSISPQEWTLEACTKRNVYESPELQLWMPLDSSVGEYKLKRGDILRVGRIQLKVKDYRIGSSSSSEDRDAAPNEDNIVDLQEKEDKPATEEDVCKICFGTEESPENPLLSICKCTGSMKFIHYLCLKMWLHSNAIERIAPQVISYYWKSFHCEICTTSYPFSVLHGERRFEMVDVPRSLTDDFLLLETVNQEKGAARAIHMVIPEKGVEYKLGRGHEADVKITDISVSRLHATVKATKRGFILLDNNSKFGTLLHLPNKAVFKFEQKPLLQIGRTKFVASVRDATAIT
eukprot:TRINITY_DN411_c0_g1_i28.p1 TRINITY_DN411_c0_g1~~TRINITY_DN411_c0_g1_i28.p1  ORF type:complete len:363 (+),score=110.01 TRINITY_DN411_c0_g1_i28:201-1289(+)